VVGVRTPLIPEQQNPSSENFLLGSPPPQEKIFYWVDDPTCDSYHIKIWYNTVFMSLDVKWLEFEHLQTLSSQSPKFYRNLSRV